MRNKDFLLRTGESFLVREVNKSDAERMLAFVNAVAGETDFLTFGENELGMSVAEEIDFIEGCRQADNQLFLLAELEGDLIGTLGFLGGGRPRCRHVGEFGVSVAKKWWGRGIGSRLIGCLFEWAKDSECVVRKINLKVRVENARAIRLYERLGFVEEGKLSREFLIDGVFHDALVMGRCVD